MSEIRIEHLCKSFDGNVAVNDVSLTVADGEFLVLLGPSGCGKTTLLRAIAGLGVADSGRIMIGDRDVTYLRPRERGISMVFQSYAIFPHMTVRDNIGFGLKMNKVAKVEIDKAVSEAAELLHIEALLDRRPSDMSGGQRQRVAVARALAMKADVILMDEPLSNLDALLRLEMRAELKRLLTDLNATTIYVTHDQIEALSMGDRIAIMNNGDLQQIDSPGVVYEQPVNQFVGGFIGNPPMNFIDGILASSADGFEALIGDQRVDLAATSSGLNAFIDQPIRLGVRAENMSLIAPDSAAEALNSVEVVVDVVEPLGAQNLLTVTLNTAKSGAANEPGPAAPVTRFEAPVTRFEAPVTRFEAPVTRFKVSTHPSTSVSPGDHLKVALPADRLRLIDPASGWVITD